MRSTDPSSIVERTSRQSPWITRFVTTSQFFYNIIAMPSSLSSDRVDARVDACLNQDDEQVVPPRTRGARAPVHVVYGGAHLYRKGSAAKLGTIAQAAMEKWGKDERAFAKLVGLK